MKLLKKATKIPTNKESSFQKIEKLKEKIKKEEVPVALVVNTEEKTEKNNISIQNIIVDFHDDIKQLINNNTIKHFLQDSDKMSFVFENKFILQVFPLQDKKHQYIYKSPDSILFNTIA